MLNLHHVYLAKSGRDPIWKLFRLIQCFDNWNGYVYFRLFSREKAFSFNIRWSLKISLEKSRIPEFFGIFLNERYTGPFKNKIGNSSEPVIVDIGAGEGYFSLYILSVFPRARVFGFEQNFGPYEKLRHHWSRYNHSSFSIYHCRVCKNDGLFVESLEYNKTLFVRSFKLITLRKKFQIKNIDLLKLSCAGNEYEILYSLPPREFLTIDQIVMDVHHIDEGAKNVNNMVDFLTENGYDVLREEMPDKKNKSMIWASRLPGKMS